jgi:hypothetical protein
MEILENVAQYVAKIRKNDIVATAFAHSFSKWIRRGRPISVNPLHVTLETDRNDSGRKRK